MAIAHRATANTHGTTSNTAQASITINKPTGTTTGDVLIAALDFNDPVDVTPPSGWLPLMFGCSPGTHDFGGAFPYAFYKVVTNGGTEPTQYQFTFSGSRYVGGVISCFSGVSNADPFSAYPTGYAKTDAAVSSNMVSPGIETTTANNMIVRIMGYKGSTNAVLSQTPPAGWTEPANGEAGHAESGNYNKVAIAYGIHTPTGATGTQSFSTSLVALYAGITIALNPAETPLAPKTRMPPPMVVEGENFPESTAARTSMSVTLPGLQQKREGDWLLVVLYRLSGTSDFSTTDTGWTFSQSTNNRVSYARKKVTASEPSSYTFSAASTVMNGMIYVIRGADATTPLIGNVSTQVAANSTWTAPASSASGKGNVLAFRFYAALSTTADINVGDSTGHTKMREMDSHATSSFRMLAIYRQWVESGSVGSATVSPNQTLAYDARTVVFYPEDTTQATASISNKGTVTVAGTVFQPAVQGAASIAAKATLTVAGTKTARGQAPISAKATLNIDAALRKIGQAIVASKGTLAIGHRLATSSSIAIAGQGQVTAAGGSFVGILNTSVSFSFPSPSSSLQGAQTFGVYVRKYGSGSHPQARVEVLENGILRGTVVANTPISSTTGTWLVGEWDASVLQDTSGTNVEMRVVGTGADGGTLEVAAKGNSLYSPYWLARQGAVGGVITKSGHLGIAGKGAVLISATMLNRATVNISGKGSLRADWRPYDAYHYLVLFILSRGDFRDQSQALQVFRTIQHRVLTKPDPPTYGGPHAVLIGNPRREDVQDFVEIAQEPERFEEVLQPTNFLVKIPAG